MRMGTKLATARRIFFDLRNTMAGSDQSIVDEIEVGEDQEIKAKFEAALAGEELPPAVKSVVIRVFASVQDRSRSDARYQACIPHTGGSRLIWP